MYNPIRNKKKMRKRAARNRSIVLETKHQPCSDCKVSYPPIVMDFHHVKGVKKFSIARSDTKSKKMLLDEIAKCELLCANCHRLKHG